jgi:hypothetical protein
VDDVSVALEHVDLLNALDGLDVELLQRGLELLVVGTSGPVDLLDLPAGSTLAAIYRVSLAFLMSSSFPVSRLLPIARCGVISRVRDILWCGAVKIEKRLAYPKHTS